MNEHLRDRVLRKLETLSDERGYQVLDYIEFLESKYAERQAAAPNMFTRFTEALEDRLRAGKVSASAIAETMGLMNRAMNVLNGVATGVAAAGRSVASDFERAAAARQGVSTPAGTAAGGTQTSTSSGRPSQTASGTGSPGGAPVAGSGVAGGDAEVPPPMPPPASAGPGSPDDPGATESGELDPPAGR